MSAAAVRRRTFLMGMGALFAAPALVRAASIMSISVRSEAALLPWSNTGMKFLLQERIKTAESAMMRQIADALLSGQGFALSSIENNVAIYEYTPLGLVIKLDIP